MLRSRLIEVGWRDNLKVHCTGFPKKKLSHFPKKKKKKHLKQK